MTKTASTAYCIARGMDASLDFGLQSTPAIIMPQVHHSSQLWAMSVLAAAHIDVVP